MEPILLEPVGKDYIWGGTRLKSEYGKNIDLTPLAETWECSTHPDGPSRVVNGEFAGRTLDEVLSEHPEFLGRKVKSAGKLPILIKLIDAAQDLSVQVHPNDEYARMYEGQNGKSELWCVLDAEPGASIVFGFAHPVTKDILSTALKSGSFAKHLQKVPVHKGDVYYIPAGMIHSIGAGTLIAEIQESSNVTYRVFDYDRVDKNGNKRPLHFAKAMDVLNMRPASQARQRPRTVKCCSGSSKELICRCRYFSVERVWVSKEYSYEVSDDSFQVVLCVEGQMTLKCEGSEWGIRKGQCLFLPAGVGSNTVSGAGVLFKITC